MSIHEVHRLQKETQESCSACSEFSLNDAGEFCPKHLMEKFWKGLDLEAQYTQRQELIKQEAPGLFDEYRDQRMEGASL